MPDMAVLDTAGPAGRTMYRQERGAQCVLTRPGRTMTARGLTGSLSLPDRHPAPAWALIKSCIFMAVRGDLEYNAWSFCPQPGSGPNSQAAMDSADSCVQCTHQRPSWRRSRRRSGPWHPAAYRFRSLKLSTLRCPACPEHNGTVPAVYRKCPETVTVNSCGRELQAYVFSL